MLLIMWDHRRGDLFDITDKNMNALADDPRFPDSIRARSKDTRKSAAKCQQGMAARGLLEPVRSTTLRTADGKLFRLIAYRFTAETIRLLKSDVDDELPPPTDDDEQPSDPPPPAASPEAAPEVGEAAATPDVTDPPVEPESDHVPGATVADRLLLRPFGPAIGNLTANVATRLGRYLMNRSETQQLISKLQTLDREAEQLREEASEEEQATMDGFDRLIEKGIEQ